MHNDKTRVSRKAAPRRNAIVVELRRQIVTGLLQPGNRLPTRRALRAHFQSGVVTLQRALDRLKHEGFVSTRSTAGTYVASHPPHLSRYGLVFSSRPEGWHRWMRFWTVLSEQTEEIERITPFRMPRYYMEGSFKGEDYELLLRDVGSDRLAGLILTFPSDFLKGTALLQPRRLPMVALAEVGQEGIPAVAHDHKAFVSEALDYLASKGRRRIAVLKAGKLPNFEDNLIAGLAARGMVTHPWWSLLFSPMDTEGVRDIVHLLMHPGQDERPDGLIIADDNLVEGAVAGLVAADVRIPGDADVIAHANLPCPVKVPIPLKRLGYDIREELLACTRLIDALRLGRPVPSKTLIAPILGDWPHDAISEFSAPISAPTDLTSGRL